MGAGPMTVSIEPMTPEDLAAVVSVEGESFTEPWSQDLFGAEIIQANRLYVVAKDPSGEVCGYGGIMVSGEDAHIVTLAVAPEHREQGLGSRLLLRLINEASARQVHHLTLEVRESNIAAQDLYRKFGFDRAGIRRGYYRTEDAVIMWAVDIDSPAYRDRLHQIGRTA